MASKWTEQKISEWIREGRGRGEGAAYKPWLTVQDVPGNLGRCHRVPSRFGRPIHLLSDVEARVFYAVERSRTVLEAQEQYPIDRAISQAVARALGIRQPLLSRYEYSMRDDCRSDGHHARPRRQGTGRHR